MGDRYRHLRLTVGKIECLPKGVDARIIYPIRITDENNAAWQGIGNGYTPGRLQRNRDQARAGNCTRSIAMDALPRNASDRPPLRHLGARMVVGETHHFPT